MAIMSFERDMQDTLSYRAKEISELWVTKVRKSEQMPHCRDYSDDQLMEIDSLLYPQLYRWIKGDLSRVELGKSCVKMGKSRHRLGFALSEIMFGLSLSEQAVSEVVIDSSILDNTMDMYRAIEISSLIAEFYLAASFYITKGFLESVFTQMSEKEGLSEATLKKYFKDDFFFKED